MPKTKAEIEARRDSVMVLHLGGASTREIATLIEATHGAFSHQTIAKDINARLADIGAARDDTDKLLNRHVARLEQLLRKWWPRAVGGKQGDTIILPDTKAVKAVLVIMGQIARYSGIEPAKRLAIGGDRKSGPVEVVAKPPAIDPSKLTDRQLETLAEIYELMTNEDADADAGAGSSAE